MVCRRRDPAPYTPRPPIITNPCDFFHYLKNRSLGKAGNSVAEPPEIGVSHRLGRSATHLASIQQLPLREWQSPILASSPLLLPGAWGYSFLHGRFGTERQKRFCAPPNRAQRSRRSLPLPRSARGPYAAWHLLNLQLRDIQEKKERVASADGRGWEAVESLP